MTDEEKAEAYKESKRHRSLRADVGKVQIEYETYLNNLKQAYLDGLKAQPKHTNFVDCSDHSNIELLKARSIIKLLLDLAWKNERLNYPFALVPFEDPDPVLQKAEDFLKGVNE